MYEPVIIEDLTEWLIGVGVSLIMDKEADVEEADPQEGKKGKGRKNTKLKNKPLAPRELQPWMVRLWCQEKSICCISKASKFKR